MSNSTPYIPTRLSIDELVAADGSGPVSFPDGIVVQGVPSTALDSFVAVSWVSDDAVYFVTPEAMTLGTPTAAGTGTVTYDKALAATPTVFSSATLPVTLATGDVLRITATGVVGYKALTLRRSA